MLNKISILAGACIALLSACQNDTKATAETDPTKPKVDTLAPVKLVPHEGATTYTITEGTVYWGAKKTISGMHNGTFNVAGGEFLVNEGQLLEGKVTIDMKSVAVVDLKDPNEKNDLESHLKDTDFFEVAKYPKGEFVVDEVLPSKMPDFDHVISGFLTMKNKKSKVNIPVKMTVDGNQLTAESATFVINRTKWGINFRSGILGTAKDKMIEDNVSISLKVKAVAK